MMAHHAPDFFGITNVASAARSKKTAIKVRDQPCRVLPAAPPCDYLWDCFAWTRRIHANRTYQICLQLGAVLVFLLSYSALYCLYCSEFGVNLFDPQTITTDNEATPSSTPLHNHTDSVYAADGSAGDEASEVMIEPTLIFQTLALVIVLAMPPVVVKVLDHFNTRTRHS